jgi:hypothetical protein
VRSTVNTGKEDGGRFPSFRSKCGLSPSGLNEVWTGWRIGSGGTVLLPGPSFLLEDYLFTFGLARVDRAFLIYLAKPVIVTNF